MTETRAKVTEFLAHHLGRSEVDSPVFRALTVVMLEANKFEEFAGADLGQTGRVRLSFSLSRYTVSYLFCFSELACHRDLRGFIEFTLGLVVGELRRARRSQPVTGITDHHAGTEDTRPNPEPSYEG